MRKVNLLKTMLLAWLCIMGGVTSVWAEDVTVNGTDKFSYTAGTCLDEAYTDGGSTEKDAIGILVKNGSGDRNAALTLGTIATGNSLLLNANILISTGNTNASFVRVLDQAGSELFSLSINGQNEVRLSDNTGQDVLTSGVATERTQVEIIGGNAYYKTRWTAVKAFLDFANHVGLVNVGNKTYDVNLNESSTGIKGFYLQGGKSYGAALLAKDYTITEVANRYELAMDVFKVNTPGTDFDGIYKEKEAIGVLGKSGSGNRYATLTFANTIADYANISANIVLQSGNNNGSETFFKALDQDDNELFAIRLKGNNTTNTILTDAVNTEGTTVKTVSKIADAVIGNGSSTYGNTGWMSVRAYLNFVEHKATVTIDGTPYNITLPETSTGIKGYGMQAGRGFGATLLGKDYSASKGNAPAGALTIKYVDENDTEIATASTPSVDGYSVNTSFKYTYSKFIANGGDLYKITTDNTNATVTLTSEAQEVKVTYKKEAEGKYYFYEFDGNYITRADKESNGSAKTKTATVTVPEDGTYIVTANCYGSNSNRTATITVGDATLVESTVIGIYAPGTDLVSAETALNANDVITVTTSSSADGIDYVILQKVGEGEVDPYAGEHYLYSVANSKFLSRGANWGTRAIADNYGVPAKVAKSGDAYYIQFLDNELYLGSDGYTDKGMTQEGINTAWTIEAVEGGFLLKNGNGSYAKVTDGFVNVDGTAENATVWTFKTADEQKAIVAATQQSNILSVATAYGWSGVTTSEAFVSKVETELISNDLTSLIKSANAGNTEDWPYTQTRAEGDWNGYNVGDYGAELFRRSGTIEQKITVPEAGIYKLTLNAFMRMTNNAICQTIGGKGYSLSNAFVSVNDSYFAQIPDWYSEADGTNPDNTGQAKTAFEAGKYAVTVWAYVGEEKELTITLHQPSWVLGGCWMLFNNFKLTYYAEPAGVAVESVTLDKASAAINLGDAPITLTATVAPENADDKNIIWTSSDENVATVADGVVTAVNVGTATITATSNADDTKKATCAITVTAAAAPAYYSEIAAGDFYIVNAATGKYLGGDNAYGTQASLIKHGNLFTAAGGDGKYTLDSHTYNSETDHFFAGTYVDSKSAQLFITALGNGKYSISTADGSAFVSAKAGTTVVDNTAANANSPLAQWYFISKNDRDKMLATASAENPVDATYYIPNASFSRNQNTSFNEKKWTIVAKNNNLSSDANCAESYRSENGFNLTQTITVPNGTYRFRAQGFYRQDGEDNENKAVFFIGDKEIEFPVRTGEENTMTKAKASFDAGLYYTEWVEVTVEDHTITLGARTNNTMLWCIWDNFELEMTNYIPVTEIEASIDNTEIEVGQTANITAATVPATVSFDALTYTSSDETVATVSETGVVTSVAAGTATITIAAEMETVTKTFDVTVKVPAIIPTDITLNESQITLDAETTTFTLTAVVNPEGANQNVTFASSDENVVTVSDEGVITGITTGTATITVTSTAKAEIKATAEVTVTFPESKVTETLTYIDGAAKTVYTLSQDNLFKNGSFGYPNNPLYGWKTVGYTTDPVIDNFTINPNGGVDDGAYITTNGGSVGSEKTLRRSLPVEAGKKYYFAVYTSGKAPDSKNFQYNALYKMKDAVTEDGTLKEFVWPQGANNTSDEWSKTEYIFTADAEHPYVGVRMGWNDNTKFDEFVLVEITDETVVGNVEYATAAIPTANIGTGAFQYVQADIDAIGADKLVQDEATVEQVEAAYNALKALNVNEPADGQLFNVVLTYGGWDYDQKAMTYIANGRKDAGLYNIQYKEAANQNLAQAFTFTKVEGNNYKMSQIDADGNVRYISTGTPWGGNTTQIRTTTNADDAMLVTVIPTKEEGKWNLWNIAGNNYIGSQDAGVYTVNSHIDFNIIETAKPEIAINTTAAGWGTVMLPFATELPEGVKAYTCAAVEGSKLTLTEVEKLEANKPYLIEGAWNATVTGDAQGTALNYTEGIFTGVYSDTKAPADSYVLLNKNNKLGFYKVVAEKEPTVTANHAYLTVASNARDAFFFDEDETTGIDAIKALADGDAEIYNTNGVRIPSLQKGMNIVKMGNGAIRKIMVK